MIARRSERGNQLPHSRIERRRAAHYFLRELRKVLRCVRAESKQVPDLRVFFARRLQRANVSAQGPGFGLCSTSGKNIGL
jgi:hypothetical protein